MATKVKEEKGVLDIDIQELLGNPGSENLLGSDEKEEKGPANIFSNKQVDTSFIDEEEDEEEEEKDDPEDQGEDPEKKVTAEAAKKDLEDILNPGGEEDDEDEDEDDPSKKSNAGRKKVDKSGLTEMFKSLITNEKIVPFDDEKPIEEYSQKDFEELLLANLDNKVQEVRDQVEEEFIDSLPAELQIAAKYVLIDKGTDLKNLFRLLSQNQETKELDVENPHHQEMIAREYLMATGFGTEDDIEEEISSWKDQKVLKTKAEKFKSRLDQYKANQMNKELAEQAKRREANEKAAKKYRDDIFNTLKPATLNGLKIDRKTQDSLFVGLTQPTYVSQVSGKPINMLGHLLEKYQMVEPNHALVAEALYLLKDPEGYRAKVREIGAQEQTKKTVRTLKTEESKKTGSSGTIIEEEHKTTRKLPRNNNIFKY